MSIPGIQQGEHHEEQTRPVPARDPRICAGVGLGGVSIHYAAAQGAFGLTSVKQIGSALVEMQKNVDDLQKNMGTLKAAKDQLGALPAEGGTGILKKAIPGMDR